MKRALAALFLVPALQGQVVIATGDATLSLARILAPHPEGLILLVPGTDGRSLAAPVQAALDQEPAIALQLVSQELDRAQAAGREFIALGGWSDGRPRWALLGPDRRIRAEGTEAPTPAALADAYGRSPLRTRADALRDFLRANPDQGEAQAQLVLALRDLAERRTERMSLSSSQAALSGEDDDRIWSAYAEAYERFFAMDLWRGADPGPASPVPLAAQLSVGASRSPRLRDLAARLLPRVEDAIRERPSDAHRWAVWLSFREAGARGRAGAALAGLDPLPGTRRWPPEAAVDAFVAEARDSGDWRAAEPVLQAAFDANEAFLQKLGAAAKADARNRGGADMGAAFGFAQWNGETATLVEAKLRLGKLDEADRIATRVLSRVPRREFADAAAQLARDCGAEALADKWSRIGK